VGAHAGLCRRLSPPLAAIHPDGQAAAWLLRFSFLPLRASRKDKLMKPQKIYIFFLYEDVYSGII
jgi:hypothetical protein